jgi:hypothetical protein
MIWEYCWFATDAVIAAPLGLKVGSHVWVGFNSGRYLFMRVRICAMVCPAIPQLDALACPPKLVEDLCPQLSPGMVAPVPEVIESPKNALEIVAPFLVRYLIPIIGQLLGSPAPVIPEGVVTKSPA